MKLDAILESVEQSDMPPGLTPEQERLWPTLNPVMKNKILTHLLMTMAKKFTADNKATLASQSKLTHNDADRPLTRPEARMTQ